MPGNYFDQFDAPSAAPAAPASPPPYIQGTITPSKQADMNRAAEDQQIQRDAAARQAQNDARQHQKDTWSTLTPEEVSASGLAPGVYQRNGVGEVKLIGKAAAKTGKEDNAEKIRQIQVALSNLDNIKGEMDGAMFGQGVGNIAGTEAFQSVPFLGQRSANIAGGLEMVTGDLINQVRLQMSEQGVHVGASQANTEKEAQRIAASIANLSQTQDEGNFARGLDNARAFYQQRLKELGAGDGGEVASDDAGQSAQQVPGFDYATTQVRGNTSGVRNEDDPALAGVVAGYRQLLEQNTPPGQVVKWLRERGVTDPEVLRTTAQQAAFRLKNPSVPLDKYDIDKVDDRVIPLSGMEKAITTIGDNPVGAYLMKAGNFLAANSLDSLSPNPERARAALDVMDTQYPNASAAGEVSGGVMSSLLGEAALARLGMGAGFTRGLTADVAMGAANGAGAADDGNRGLNALMGGATAAAGNVAGNALMRGAGRLVAPTGGSQKVLYDAGVRPTLGQRVADKGVVGNIVNRAEQGLQSVPLVGSAIRGAREEARDQFQIGAFNEALGEVGEQLPKGMKPGTDPHNYAQKTFDRVYTEARKGMRMVGDEELSNDLASLSEQVGQLSEPSMKRFNKIFADIVSRRVKDGELSGDAYKDAYSGLGKVVSKIRNSQSGDGELAGALEDLKVVLESAARRHSCPSSEHLAQLAA